jgi:hypothetical protein
MFFSALGVLDELGGDGLAGEVFGLLEGRVFGDGEHPLDAHVALLGVGERGDALDVGLVFENPVVAGEAGVEGAVLDVASHLLRADEHALDLGVVDGGKVAAAAGVDVPAGAGEESEGGVLEAAFGDAEFELVRHCLRSVLG